MPRQRTFGVYLYVQVRVCGKVLPHLVPHMLQQVPVGDRSYLFRKYERCFSGADAVRFFRAKGYARSEREAVALGNVLLRSGLFRHVKNEHLFRNGNYFYRFAAHEEHAIEEETLNLRSSRLMTVACTSYMHIPEITRVETIPILPDSSDGDEMSRFIEGSLLSDSQPEYSEADVLVQTGIRIGANTFPDLVSEFGMAKDLVATNMSKGKVLEKSFTGTQATGWFLRHSYANTEEEAIHIGNAMMSSGVFFPLQSERHGFECNSIYYRMTADMDITKELRRGARKDNFLKFFGFDRTKAEKGPSRQSPWFEDEFFFSSASSGSSERAS